MRTRPLASMIRAERAAGIRPRRPWEEARKGPSIHIISYRGPRVQTYSLILVWPEHQWEKGVMPWICLNCGLIMEPGWEPGQCARSIRGVTDYKETREESGAPEDQLRTVVYSARPSPRAYSDFHAPQDQGNEGMVGGEGEADGGCPAPHGHRPGKQGDDQAV